MYSKFLIKDTMKNAEGIKFNGINITDLRYADDAVLVVEKRKKMQKMIDGLNQTCKAYLMKINVRKTKVMIMNKTENPKRMQRCVMLDKVPLEQVTHFKYLDSWITEDAKRDRDIRAGVGMAKAAFWQSKMLMKRKIRFNTKMKILNCYAFLILNYGYESWTWNKARK